MADLPGAELSNTMPILGKRADSMAEAYGLKIKSDIPLPQLPHAHSDLVADVTVTRCGSPTNMFGSETTNAEGRYVWGDSLALTVGWNSIGELRISNGKRIDVYPLEEVGDATLSPVIMGVGMGVIMAQRGYYVLHASAVSLESGTVVFLGFKGDGKSTMAASLVSRGHQLVTDDVLALPPGGLETVSPAPGPRVMKLWPENLSAALMDKMSYSERVHPEYDKRIVWSNGESVSPRPISVIYVLEEADGISVSKVEGQAAVIELLRHAYAPRFFRPFAESRRHLQAAAKLAEQVPIFRLSRPSNLSQLPEISGMIEAHSASFSDH